MGVSRICEERKRRGNPVGLRAILWGCFTALAHATIAAPATVTRLSSPCTENETWAFGGDLDRGVPADARAELALLVSGQRPPFRGFAEALALKKARPAGSPAAVFADYWRGRAYYQAELPEMAATEFNRLLANPPAAALLPMQIAAMACLERIHHKFPAIELSPAVYANLPFYFRPGLVPPQYLPVVREAWAQRTLKLIARGEPPGAVESALSLLKGGGQLEDFVRATWAISRGQRAIAIPILERLIADPNPITPLRNRRDELRTLLARQYYQAGRYADAIRHWELIEKSSNELVSALAALASAQLMTGNLMKAIGAAVSLQSGALKHTFAPQGLLVTAMALNELCQFPESLHSLNSFKRNYQASWRWLRDHTGNGKKAAEPLYPLAIEFLKEGPKTIPDRVAGEWLRSSVFITRQEALNLLFRTRRAIPGLVREGIALRDADAQELAEKHKDLLARIQDVRKRLKRGEPFPQELRQEIVEQKAREGRQKHLVSAQPEWRAELTRSLQASEARERELTAAIEGELRRLDQRMLQQLNDALENAELVEAEIWNGAGQDIVFQNAHPDYQEMVKKGKLSGERAPAGSAGDVYDWGSSSSTLTGGEEIWEDELGAMQANLHDNCADKEKYMKLQRRE